MHQDSCGYGGTGEWSLSQCWLLATCAEILRQGYENVARTVNACAFVVASRATRASGADGSKNRPRNSPPEVIRPRPRSVPEWGAGSAGGGAAARRSRSRWPGHSRTRRRRPSGPPAAAVVPGPCRSPRSRR
ncbi:hypothetical protein MicB006_3751 [Micromonospora sp. B006]|nr:hypothetical protein MicB006_3751 [Micromonospora sp. B006]